MSLKKLYVFVFGLMSPFIVMATPPVEVIGSCKNDKAVNPSVTMTRLITPGGAADEPHCDDHYQRTENNFTYGMIACDDDAYIILNNIRTKLSKAQNYSVNPSIKPGSPISVMSRWSTIKFGTNSYLCIKDPLSDSGQGASRVQHYIIENAYLGTPIVYYYFFDKDIMPLTSTD